MAQFEIQLRINKVFLDGRRDRGKWQTFKKYRSFQSVIDAWDDYKNRRRFTSSVFSNGKYLYDYEHQYRAYFKEEKASKPETSS